MDFLETSINFLFFPHWIFCFKNDNQYLILTNLSFFYSLVDEMTYIKSQDNQTHGVEVEVEAFCISLI